MALLRPSHLFLLCPLLFTAQAFAQEAETLDGPEYTWEAETDSLVAGSIYDMRVEQIEADWEEAAPYLDEGYYCESLDVDWEAGIDLLWASAIGGGITLDISTIADITGYDSGDVRYGGDYDYDYDYDYNYDYDYSLQSLVTISDVNGDINGDGSVNVVDLQALWNAFDDCEDDVWTVSAGSDDWRYDIDGDGRINWDDLTLLRDLILNAP